MSARHHCLALALLCAPGLARAEAPRRSDLILEGELGFAVMSATTTLDSDAELVGGTLIGHLGGFLAPRLSLLIVAGFTGGDTEDLVSVTEAHLGVAGRFWMTPRLWAEGSLSASRLIVSQSFDDSSVPGARLGLAGAFVLYEGQQINLDGRIGVSAGGYGDRGDSSSIWFAVGLTNR